MDQGHFEPAWHFALDKAESFSKAQQQQMKALARGSAEDIICELVDFGGCQVS